MPNPYAIYLHDTPARGLFEQPVRDFSSGCVRVQDIGELVDQLLTVGDLERAVSFYDQLESRESGYIRLAEPIDVFLVYFTAWVDASGEIQFRPDIYNLDRPLILSLQQQYPPEANKLAHQQPENIPLPD
jgi:murein L,D-transpeptidase YcbB/YkuD